MSIFTGKTKAGSTPLFGYFPETSLEDRTADASALAAYATDVFVRTASDLDEAAARQEDVAAEAGAEILVLQDLADNALNECLGARTAAHKIRAIFA